MSTIIDGTTGITTDGLSTSGSISTSGTVTASGLILGTGTAQLIKLETAKATTSGTAIDFTGIPSWAKKITVMFNGVSTNGSWNMTLQLGDSGGIETTGYLGAYAYLGASAGSANHPTSAFTVQPFGGPAAINHGIVVLTTLGSNIWSCSYNMSRSDANQSAFGTGTKSLSDVLTQIRITTFNGTDTFDAGSINILIEGSL